MCVGGGQRLVQEWTGTCRVIYGLVLHGHWGVAQGGSGGAGWWAGGSTKERRGFGATEGPNLGLLVGRCTGTGNANLGRLRRLLGC